MNNIYKLSVIIPIYNSEKFLKRSINSIIRQSIGFENIELILVNNKSTDKSKEIMEAFSDKYSNIKTFHSNIHYDFPGYGRNIGLKNSNAEYIMFIDSDDEYDEKFCEIMLNTINKEQCDVVCANYNIKYKQRIDNISCFSKITEYKKTKFNNKLVDLTKISNINDSEIWTKIFKKSIIDANNIRLIENGLNEDSLFLYEYYVHAKKLVYIDYTGYTWYRDRESRSGYTAKTTIEYINSYYVILDFVKKNFPNFNYNQFYQGCIETTLIRSIYSSNKKRILKELYKFEKTNDFKGELKNKWIEHINSLVLKQKYSAVIIILNLLCWMKIILDYFRTIQMKLHLNK